jgi:N-acetyl-anhydromuramyl-L-alanine amidase AmpD
VGGLGRDTKPKDTRTPKQKAALLKLLRELRGRYPKSVIVGHRDFSKDLNRDGVISPNEWMKACPSFDAKGEYKTL